MPSLQSSPAASLGATPASVAAARTRSPSNAAHASACGPPPDQPVVTHSSAPMASSTAAASAAQSAMVRPGARSDPA